MPGSFPGVRGQHSGVDVVADAVRRARLDAGLSQAAVAQPQYTRAAIHQVEKGRARPSLQLLRQIAHRTGRPVSYFLASTTITPEEREAIDELYRLVSTTAFADAIAYGERLLERDLAREIEAEARFLIGRAYVRTLDGKRAYPHLIRARDLYELTGDQTQLADVLNQLACALYLLEDSRALGVAYEALDVCDRLRPAQSELTIRTLIVLGMIFKRLQDWNQAITYYRRALDMIGSEMGIRNLAMIHDHLSQSYQRVGRFAEALRHARKMARLYRSSLDPTDLFRAEHNLGETLLRQGELRAARPHLERALTICEERDLRRQARCEALLSMAELNIACGELDEAETRLAQALDLAVELDERGHQAMSHRLSGRLHLKRGEYPAADKAFTKAARMFEELQRRADLFDIQAEHAQGLHDQGRTDEALELSLQAIASGRAIARRIEGGWGDVVARERRR